MRRNGAPRSVMELSAIRRVKATRKGVVKFLSVAKGRHRGQTCARAVPMYKLREAMALKLWKYNMDCFGDSKMLKMAEP